MILCILTGLLALAGLPLGSVQGRTLTRDLAGGRATLQIGGAEEPTASAVEAAFAALGEAAGDPGAACDAALRALGDAGFPAACAGFRGALAAGAPPPGAPGWMTPVGFGTAGYPLSLLPLAHAGLARSSAPGDPLRVSVIAPSAAEAVRLAEAARAAGRRAGRALVEAASGATLFLEDTRFRPLFDQRTLEGWTTRGGPYDGDARWSVEAGAITGRTGADGAGGLLYTEERFTSFELELEAFVDEPFDSGIFVRMVPGARGLQVTLDNRPDGEIGGIYSDGWLSHNPAGKARLRQGRFNHFELRVTGFAPRVEVWLNGEPLADYRLPMESTGFAAAGRIGLQVHDEAASGADEHAARFRNVRIRELPVFGEAPGAGEGFARLFDGASLAGFEVQGQGARCRVEPGELVLGGDDGQLVTQKDYADFELSLDFQLGKLANSGVFLRAARDGSNPAFSGAEVQLLDDFHWEELTKTTLKSWQKCASLYGAVPAGESGLRQIGEWNRLELFYRGARLAVALNGRLLYDVDTHALAPESGAPFAERARTGFLGLQCHAPPQDLDEPGAGEVRFQNLYVRELSPR
jgi:hypothetical protein